MNNKSRYRQKIRNITVFFGFIICLSFLYVFTKGVLWSPPLKINLSLDIPLGSTELKRFGNKRYWVSHLSEIQRKQLNTLNSMMNDRPHCDIQPEEIRDKNQYCAISAETNRSGIIIRYIKEKPFTLAKTTPWYGGFVDPSTGNFFDLMGRKYP